MPLLPKRKAIEKVKDYLNNSDQNNINGMVIFTDSVSFVNFLFFELFSRFLEHDASMLSIILIQKKISLIFL